MSVIESITKFEGRVFTVSRDRVRLPHGVESTLDVVRHRGSVVLIPMLDDGSVMLVRQYRHAIGQAVWELPAGSLDPGEDADRAARRECHEEIGLVPDQAEWVASLYPSPGYTTELMHFYRLTGLHTPEQTAAQDEDEHLEPRPFTVEALRAAVANGEIVDMKTVVALQFLPAISPK
ncbi:MAG: NUDIX hydrolase [Acidobacteria bacterium]|nr:NUDIX hydrolase [Acidobacteriota bacterium]